jgi:hypothetical protein
MFSVGVMNKVEFASRMLLPNQWLTHELYVDELFSSQYREYVSSRGADDGDGQAWEHYRNGVYWYWLKRKGDCDNELVRRLIDLEPDVRMREWLGREITRLWDV